MYFFICIYNYNVLSSKCILSNLLHFMTSIASFKMTFIIEHLLLGKIPYKNITHHIKLMIYFRRETERLHCNNWWTLLSWLEATKHVSGDWLWLIKWQADFTVMVHATDLSWQRRLRQHVDKKMENTFNTWKHSFVELNEEY